MSTCSCSFLPSSSISLLRIVSTSLQWLFLPFFSLLPLFRCRGWLLLVPLRLFDQSFEFQLSGHRVWITPVTLLGREGSFPVDLSRYLFLSVSFHVQLSCHRVWLPFDPFYCLFLSTSPKVKFSGKIRWPSLDSSNFF